MMVAALLMLLGLSLTVFMAARIAVSNSRMMLNNRQYRNNLYRAESVISLAAETHRETWLAPGSDLLRMGKADAVFRTPADEAVEIRISEQEMQQAGRYEIYRVEQGQEQFYALPHKAPAMIGSGTSGKKEIRRYGIRATGTNGRSNGKVVLEAGFAKVF